MLIGQSRNPNSPFTVEDWSVKSASPGWRLDARNRIARSSQVIVLCGRYMSSATGVDVEIGLARETRTPYFLLKGVSDATRPAAALSTDKLYDWTWDNLKLLIAGRR